ncbi:hypothetical protein FXO38_04916 [Capsicum annuum]|nr:hypothetical protein FXO38_04916 [Capsicum annuum]KAF3677659.1 hypothetical protein FXO37_04730 [Capsicum annuum]
MAHFSSISSQRINFAKSRIFFSANTSVGNKSIAQDVFNIREGDKFGKYLGYPIKGIKPRKEDALLSATTAAAFVHSSPLQLCFFGESPPSLMDILHADQRGDLVPRRVKCPPLHQNMYIANNDIPTVQLYILGILL